LNSIDNGHGTFDDRLLFRNEIAFSFRRICFRVHIFGIKHEANAFRCDSAVHYGMLGMIDRKLSTGLKEFEGNPTQID
jgi:hypothetical protein